MKMPGPSRIGGLLGLLALLVPCGLVLGLPARAASEAQIEDLMEAAQQGDLTTIERLRAGGVDVGAKDRDGWTTVMHDAYRGQTGLVQRLISAGVDIDAVSYYGETALMIAARQGHATIVRALLDAGARADVATRDGDTALKIAERERFPAIVDMLRARPAVAGSEVRRRLQLGNVGVVPPPTLDVRLSGDFAERDGRVEVRILQAEITARSGAVQLRQMRMALCRAGSGDGFEQMPGDAIKIDALLLPGRTLERRNLVFTIPVPKDGRLADYWLCALLVSDDGIIAIHGSRQRLGS